MSRVVVSFIFAAALLLGAAIDGKWKGEMGEGREVIFTLKDDGGKVTGTMSGPNGEPRPITQGEWKGENIAFTVASEWQGSPVKLLVKGTVNGSEMKLRIESEGGDWGTDAAVRKVE